LDQIALISEGRADLAVASPVKVFGPLLDRSEWRALKRLGFGDAQIAG